MPEVITGDDAQYARDIINTILGTNTGLPC